MITNTACPNTCYITAPLGLLYCVLFLSTSIPYWNKKKTVLGSDLNNTIPISLSLFVVEQVAVYDYIWTEDDSLSSAGAPSDETHTEGGLPPGTETSTHVVIHTLYLSGLKQRYRHFIRQPDGAIVEVRLVKSCFIALRENCEFFKLIFCMFGTH